MEITTQLEGDEMHIALQGRLDAAWSQSVNKALQDIIHDGAHHIALDLAQVNYLSSAGIRVLVLLVKNLKAIGGTLRLIAPSPAVSEVLQLVGFTQLLDSPSLTAGTIHKPAAKPARPCQQLQLAGYGFSVYTLDEAALQQGVVIGSAQPLTQSAQTLTLSEDSWVIGLGNLGEAHNAGLAGELLAVAGLAVSLPGNDPEHPDWLQQEGGLRPKVSVLHGLQASGPFRYLVRFGETPATPPLRLGELAQAALELCASDTVAWVLIAETAHLIGAALQVPPEPSDTDFFGFPDIRDRLLFTAEPAYAEETCLIVGVVARNPALPLATQLRPNSEDSGLFMHVHAVVVPFKPVRKGFIGLSESLEQLMDAQTLRGVLHLLNDDREGIGAGESYLR
ncbi:MAG: STAS domain-containing protein, partial [Methylovulum sp.]|nr:STAS domain-containing protein [Methylovulum sp.]